MARIPYVRSAPWRASKFGCKRHRRGFAPVDISRIHCSPSVKARAYIWQRYARPVPDGGSGWFNQLMDVRPARSAPVKSVRLRGALQSETDLFRRGQGAQ